MRLDWKIRETKCGIQNTLREGVLLVEESADGGGLLLIFGGESCKLLLQLANSLVLVAHFLDND